jgi:hypothetical protein
MPCSAAQKLNRKHIMRIRKGWVPCATPLTDSMDISAAKHVINIRDSDSSRGKIPPHQARCIVHPGRSDARTLAVANKCRARPKSSSVTLMRPFAWSDFLRWRALTPDSRSTSSAR